jgi:hypothetical protein
MGGCSSKDNVSDPKGKPAAAAAEQSSFNSSEELKNFSDFFPAGTKSSLCKNLTQEIWDEYKDKSDGCGVTFKTCIFSGVKNLDSGIGLYAGSHDSYACFYKLFDKVI